MAKVAKRAVDQLSAGERDAILCDRAVKGLGIRYRRSGAKQEALHRLTCWR